MDPELVNARSQDLTAAILNEFSKFSKQYPDMSYEETTAVSLTILSLLLMDIYSLVKRPQYDNEEDFIYMVRKIYRTRAKYKINK
jgi:hypothetical protein